MIKLTKTLLLIVLLVGCSRSEQKVTHYGAMTLTETFSVPVFDLDARHTPITRTELCLADKKDCFVAKQLNVNAFEFNDVSRLVASASMPLDDQSGLNIRFFDTKLGAQIHCDCRFLEKTHSSGDWLHEGRVYLDFGVDNTLGYYVQVIEFDRLNAKDRVFSYKRSANQIGGESKIDEAKTGLAWVSCDKTCTMYWINGPLTEVKSQATLCKQYTLDIEWKNGEPVLIRRDGGDVTKCGT
jgi:hypothetical protein